MNLEIFSKKYFESLYMIFDKFPFDEWAHIINLLEDAYTKKKTVFFIGNGGSASTASHMANDLMFGVAKNNGNGFKAASLCDNNAITMSIANDKDYTKVFSEQIKTLGRSGDILIVLTGSGNSPNLIEAVNEAHKIGLVTIGFLGMDGGMLKELVGASIVVPSDDYGLIETVHVALNHLLVDYFKELQVKK